MSVLVQCTKIIRRLMYLNLISVHIVLYTRHKIYKNITIIPLSLFPIATGVMSLNPLTTRGLTVSPHVNNPSSSDTWLIKIRGSMQVFMEWMQNNSRQHMLHVTIY